MATDLALGDRSDPTQAKVDSDGYDPDDPEDLGVIRAVISEDDGEDDTAQIS